MPVIPGNAMQEARRRLQQSNRRPSLTGETRVSVTVVDVYDTDKIELDGIPDGLTPLISLNPGTLFALVKINSSGRELFVGFKESEAQVFSTYGNSVLLQGLQGTISYRGYRPEAGKLTLVGSPKKALRGLAGSTTVFDISGIF